MKAIHKISFLVVIFAVSFAFFFGILNTTTEITYAASKSELTIEGDIATIGEYPQTRVTDDTLFSTLLSLEVGSDGYYTYEGIKYVKCTTKKPNSANMKWSNGDTIYDSSVEFFKVEPLQWYIVNKDSDSNMMMLVSVKVLDTHAWQTQFEHESNFSSYSGKYITATGVPANTPVYDWQYSEVRSWLNGDFYNNAFSDNAKKSILKVNMPASKTTSEVDVEQNVGLICYEDYEKYATVLKDPRATDYCRAQGVESIYEEWTYAMFNTITTGYWYGFIKCLRGHDTTATTDYFVRVENENSAIRPMIFVSSQGANIVKSKEEKEASTSKGLLIAGIILAIAGAGLAIPMMIITRVKYNKQMKAAGTAYKMTKLETILISVGLPLLIGGLCMAIIPKAVDGSLGVGGAKLKPGIYVQSTAPASGGGVVQVGVIAYRLNGDGTFDYTDAYGYSGGTIWSGHGKWSQSGSTVTFVWDGNPMVPAGYTVRANVYEGGTAFGQNGPEYRKV